MNRSTINATIMTVERSGMRSETSETVYGSPDGTAPAATVSLTEAEYDAANESNTYPPVHSKEHWDGALLTRS